MVVSITSHVSLTRGYKFSTALPDQTIAIVPGICCPGARRLWPALMRTWIVEMFLSWTGSNLGKRRHIVCTYGCFQK